MLARYSRCATGVDNDSAVIDFARRHNAASGALFVQGTFPETAESHWRFDCIFCVETMEHIPYEKQAAFIDAALGMLKPDGRMFITTPNESSASPPHVGVWTEAKVAELVARLGEHIVKRGWFSNSQPVGMLDTPSTHHAWVLR